MAGSAARSVDSATPEVDSAARMLLFWRAQGQLLPGPSRAWTGHLLLRPKSLHDTIGESSVRRVLDVQAARLDNADPVAPASRCLGLTEGAKAQLVAEIFAGPSPSYWVWGFCSFSCEQCLLNTIPPGTDCPPDIYGRPQTCLYECP